MPQSRAKSAKSTKVYRLSQELVKSLRSQMFTWQSETPDGPFISQVGGSACRTIWQTVVAGMVYVNELPVMLLIAVVSEMVEVLLLNRQTLPE